MYLVRLLLEADDECEDEDSFSELHANVVRNSRGRIKTYAEVALLIGHLRVHICE